VAASWPATVGPQQSPWTVDTARAWAVWVWRLASYSTFWLSHPLGRCTRVASPSTHTTSPTSAISARRSRTSARVATKVPSGWQNPSTASSPSSRSRLSPTSVLEMPTARPARRYDSPSSRTAATASRRTSSGSGGVPPRPRGRGGVRWARWLASQASTVAGSDERGHYANGTRPPGRVSTLPMVWSRQCQGVWSITDTLTETNARQRPTSIEVGPRWPFSRRRFTESGRRLDGSSSCSIRGWIGRSLRPDAIRPS
jgi:hypothetical protein